MADLYNRGLLLGAFFLGLIVLAVLAVVVGLIVRRARDKGDHFDVAAEKKPKTVKPPRARKSRRDKRKRVDSGDPDSIPAASEEPLAGDTTADDPEGFDSPGEPGTAAGFGTIGEVDADPGLGMPIGLSELDADISMGDPFHTDPELDATGENHTDENHTDDPALLDPEPVEPEPAEPPADPHADSSGIPLAWEHHHVEPETPPVFEEAAETPSEPPLPHHDLVPETPSPGDDEATATPTEADHDGDTETPRDAAPEMGNAPPSDAALPDEDTPRQAPGNHSTPVASPAPLFATKPAITIRTHEAEPLPVGPTPHEGGLPLDVPDWVAEQRPAAETLPPVPDSDPDAVSPFKTAESDDTTW